MIIYSRWSQAYGLSLSCSRRQFSLASVEAHLSAVSRLCFTTSYNTEEYSNYHSHVTYEMCVSGLAF